MNERYGLATFERIQQIRALALTLFVLPENRNAFELVRREGTVNVSLARESVRRI